MILFLFDCGGTLINDPFPDSLQSLQQFRGRRADLESIFTDSAFEMLAKTWQTENATSSFPFASHFLQEEIWIIRSLRRLAQASMIGFDDIPLVAPQLLREYRAHAKWVI